MTKDTVDMVITSIKEAVKWKNEKKLQRMTTRGSIPGHSLRTGRTGWEPSSPSRRWRGFSSGTLSQSSGPWRAASCHRPHGSWAGQSGQ